MRDLIVSCTEIDLARTDGVPFRRDPCVQALFNWCGFDEERIRIRKRNEIQLLVENFRKGYG
ncbi:MAG: hypothetical protein NTW14_11145 [bacterium]|nr:hypothetical protein [bacterium]